MKRIITLSVLAFFLNGCSEIIPEYIPFSGEPSPENVITVNTVPSIAYDGTIWSVSDYSRKVYWLKDGEIKSSPIFYNNDWIRGNETVENVFFYMQKNRLVMHSLDSVVLIETPIALQNDYYSYSIRATEKNIVLMVSESRIYWVLTETGWVENNVPANVSDYPLSENYFDEYGRFSDNYILFAETASIFNLITGEHVTFNPNFQDEWGSSAYPQFERQCFDQNGNAYGVAGEQLVRLNRESGTCENIPVNIPNVNNPQIKQVRVSKNNDIWVVFTDQELTNIYAHKLGSDTFSSTNYWAGSGFYDHRKLFADSQGRLWFFDYILEAHSENGLDLSYEPIPNNFDFYYHNNHSNTIMKEDETGAVWFGQIDSNSFFLHRYKDGTWTNYSNYFHFESY